MKKIFHALITRFNIEYLVKVPSILGGLPSLWLEQRMDLFFEYCYPSVVKQSNKNFIWLIYFDVNTPKETLNLFKFRDSENIINVRLADSWINIDQVILKDLASKFPLNFDYFVSSRLDNDDALRYDFIEKAHDLVNDYGYSEKTILDFQNGYIYDQKRNQIFEKKIESNPFILLVEPKSQKYSTVFAFQHKEMKYHFNSVVSTDERMWSHIIHDSNLVNKVSGRSVYINSNQIRNSFGFEPKIYFWNWLRYNCNYFLKKLF